MYVNVLVYVIKVLLQNILIKMTIFLTCISLKSLLYFFLLKNFKYKTLLKIKFIVLMLSLMIKIKYSFFYTKFNFINQIK